MTERTRRRLLTSTVIAAALAAAFAAQWWASRALIPPVLALGSGVAASAAGLVLCAARFRQVTGSAPWRLESVRRHPVRDPLSPITRIFAAVLAPLLFFAGTASIADALPFGGSELGFVGIALVLSGLVLTHAAAVGRDPLQS